MIGQTVGHYRILAKLGEGGMGVVYEAEDLRLKRRVALKFLPPAATRSARARQRFVLEAQAASALDHINICTVHEIDETEDGRVFIAMARYEGETVREKIGRGPLSLGEALDIAQQTARGLAEAHGRGIVHRDIKPGNVFVTNAGVVKILDFGLAKLAGVLSLTETGTAIGTAPYMSPEQTRASDVDHRTDIWSLGVLLYEMLAATPPFSGEHTAAVVQSILNETPHPLSRVRPGLPAELDPILQRALAKDPGRRYPRVEDLLADLSPISNLLGSEIRTKSATAPRRPSPPRSRYKAAAVLAALALAAGLYLLRERFAPPSGRVDSIAVLPFENLSSDLEQQYFVDGMHDALIADLAQIHALKVISRTSVERYRESEKTIPEIARELNVDAVVEGSVLRSKDQVRITVQLIRGSTDEHLWASSYERDLKNVLALVGEAAQAISDEIEVALSPEEKAHFAENHEVDTEAHEAYLKGRYFVNKFTGKDLRKSVQYFRESVEIDPDFALGWAGLAGAHVLIAYLGDEREAVDKAETAAARALALDDRISAPYTALGWVRLMKWEWKGAREAFVKALALNPNDVDAQHGYGDYLSLTGHLEEGLAHVRRGFESDPFSPIYGVPVTVHLYMMHRYEDAIAEAQKLLELESHYPVQGWLARSYWQMGMFPEALAAFSEAAGSDRRLVEALSAGSQASGPKGAMRAVAELLVARSKKKRVAPLAIAVWYARAAEVDRAMEWLERAYREHSVRLFYIELYPDYDPLRSDPRFRDLIHRLGLEDGAGVLASPGRGKTP